MSDREPDPADAGTDPGPAAGSTATRGVPPIAVAVIALVAGLVGFAIGGTVTDPAGGAAAAADGAVAADAPTLDPDGGVVSDPWSALGDPDAPVTIELYSDFGCPFCTRHDREVEPELIARYVDTGLARIVWYDVPFQGQASFQLAVAGRAAERQDRFWEFKEQVFLTDGRDASPATLDALASAAGLDLDRFREDLADPALEQRVGADVRLAQSLGIRGTPAFLINDRAVMGAQSLEVFVEAIELALDEAGQT